MPQTSTRAACLRLEEAWQRRDFADCARVLDDAVASRAAGSNNGPALHAIVQRLRRMTPPPAHANDAGLARFNHLRDDLMQKAGAMDADLRLALFADDVIALREPREWAGALLNYVAARADAICDKREHIWENVALVHWGIGRLADTYVLNESALIMLLATLRVVHMSLNWQVSDPSMLRIVMQDENTRLQKLIAAKVVDLAQTTGLAKPGSFISFDADGQLLPILASDIARRELRDPPEIALLFFLRETGVLDQTEFMTGVAALPVLLVSEHRTTIVAGENPPFPLCRPLMPQQSDDRERRFHLSWWLDVNFPREQIGHPAHLASRIPLFVRQLLLQGAATLVLNGSGEASWFSAAWLDQVAELAEFLNIRQEQILYLPQNLRFADQSKAARRTRHRGAATLVAPFNQHLLYKGWQAEPGEAQPRKRFLCFNQKLNAHRLALLLHMHRDGLLDEAHFSFNQAAGVGTELDGTALAPWMALPPSDIDAVIEAISPKLPMRLDLVGAGLADAADGNYVWRYAAPLFADAALYLVTETEMEGGAMCRFTEKTVKGFAAEIPFLLFGNYMTLAALRDLGFRTFAPVIDESYDTLIDPHARFQAVYAEVKRFAAMPMAALVQARQLLRPVLEHNRQHLLSIGPMLHDRLAPLFDPPEPPPAA